jgi:hypothetical protein
MSEKVFWFKKTLKNGFLLEFRGSTAFLKSAEIMQYFRDVRLVKIFLDFRGSTAC